MPPETLLSGLGQQFGLFGGANTTEEQLVQAFGVNDVSELLTMFAPYGVKNMSDLLQLLNSFGNNANGLFGNLFGNGQLGGDNGLNGLFGSLFGGAQAGGGGGGNPLSPLAGFSPLDLFGGDAGGGNSNFALATLLAGANTPGFLSSGDANAFSGILGQGGGLSSLLGLSNSGGTANLFGPNTFNNLAALGNTAGDIDGSRFVNRGLFSNLFA